MKLALIYMSRHGSTEKLARQLATSFDGDVGVFNLAEDTHPDIKDFDGVIIGGSIHYGSIQKEIQLFCKRNLSELLKKRLGLFVCCLLSTRDSDQFERSYPLILRAHCSAAAIKEI
ncbi:flavodoxin domain-containing protein [Arcticibacter sp.]|uniref:flavodoxin domain-containing protein n=1 Tax=Arcticibacter sp. TaxID=1872630 RepID=UPI00388D9B5B